MPPDERKQRMAELRSKRRETWKRRSVPTGTPPGLDTYQWAVTQDLARKEAIRIMKLMDINDALPENPIARKAMQDALELLASPVTTKDRISVIRTLLEYNHSKPAQKQDVTVRTAEDFLDEIADKEPND